MGGAITWPTICKLWATTSHFAFLAARRSRLDFGFGPFAGRSDANPPTFGAIPQHLPVAEYFIPFRL